MVQMSRVIYGKSEVMGTGATLNYAQKWAFNYIIIN